MPCFHPIEGYRSRTVNSSGKRSIVFSRRLGFVDLPVTIPCGQCIGCRLERSRQWAMRCVHEASFYQDNCFITLTYDDANLPTGGSLLKADFQKFIKRLRKKYGTKIRYFHCGEYGETTRRAHYHAIIFNHTFSDKSLYSENHGNSIYTSETLSMLWPKGFATFGSVTFESAAYVARYSLKKINGAQAAKHYVTLIPETGELYPIIPEYITMSLKPAIGKRWLEKYLTDVYPSDEVILRGMKLKPPKYYDKLYDLHNHASLEKIKGARIKQGKKHKEDQTLARLADREKCKLAQIKTLIRTLK